MGWLRDFMTLSEPPLPSFGKLAEACLEHPDWPTHSRPKHRSLSTLFSKLDRKQDLDWLRDRIEVQQVLAQLLNRTISDVRAAVGETPYISDARFLRLSDVRYAREIDLAQEEPPPGIPREVYDTPSWQCSWWHATPGSGRSLVGSWLQCRGLAHVSQIRAREDLEKLPGRGPLFLEVDSLLRSDELRLARADLESLRATERPILFAAGFPPSEELQMKVVESAPPRDYLPELVDWVAERLDGTGHFHADRAEQWMRKVALPAGAVENFGDALGLLGMIDEVHPRSLLAKSLDEIGQYFVRRRVREANETTSLSPRLSDDAYPALQECAARVLVTGSNALHSSHPVDEWTALLSTPQNEDVPDPEWFTSALRGALGTQITRRDLRRAARKLQPGAFQLTRSLEAAGLLVRRNGALPRDEDGAERHLRPRWLVSLLASRAAQEVLRLAPSQWGQVLLSGSDSGPIVGALLDAAREGDFKAVFAVVDDFESGIPEMVAALEGAVVATGFSALEGVAIPDELVEGLLNHTAESCLVLSHIPKPRLTCDHIRGPFESTHWAMALSALCVEHQFPHEHLDPVRSDSALLRAHFVNAALTLLSPSSEFPPLSTTQGVGTLTLLNALAPQGSPLRPACLLFLDTLDKASEEKYERALRQCPIDYLLRYWAQTKQSEQRFFKQWWTIVDSRPDPTGTFTDSSLARLAWGGLPQSSLRKRIESNLDIEYQYLLPHQYSDWFTSKEPTQLPPPAALHCPLDAALVFLQERGVKAFHLRALRTLIGRAPGRFGPYLLAAIKAEKTADVGAILIATPREASAALTSELPPPTTLLKSAAALVEFVRDFLSRATRERHPDFEVCYAFLTALEEDLSPLRRLPPV